MIEIEAVERRYDGVAVLSEVTLSLPRGGLTAIIGPNGAGKSTLLSVMGRLQKPDAGTVTLEGLDLTRAPGREVAKKLALLRQDNHTAARLTVRDLVGFGRYPHCRGNPGPEDHAQVTRALETLGLEPLADRFLDQLSGGQRQRAHIAMVLAQDTECILLDEPLNNLDIRHTVRIITLVRDAARHLGKTVVVVLHDINMAAAHCDRIVVMKGGRVLRHGTPERVMEAGFLSEVYETPIRVHDLEGRLVALY